MFVKFQQLHWKYRTRWWVGSNKLLFAYGFHFQHVLRPQIRLLTVVKVDRTEIQSICMVGLSEFNAWKCHLKHIKHKHKLSFSHSLSFYLSLDGIVLSLDFLYIANKKLMYQCCQNGSKSVYLWISDLLFLKEKVNKPESLPFF